ncbi:MAG TPA: cytochrome C [Desulfobacterales bacterium]|nr:cytochrome C [Desulfobacterales bacterium]
MQPSGFRAKHNTHVLRVLIVLVVLGVAGGLARALLLPSSFGKYGHYRADAVREEMRRPLRNMTNESCLACHPNIKKIHLAGVHRTVSCEVCHSAYADHIAEGKVVAKMPVRRGEEIRTLCLRCHNRIIRARPKESIKMIAMPDHLEQKGVRTDHLCNQCHHVHAPLKWIREARAAMGLPERPQAAAEGGVSWMRD